MTDLKGRTALVTGGAVGIGRGIALELACAGADVAITYRSHDGDEVAGEIRALGRQACALELDATSGPAVADAVGRAAEALGRHIDILVNNAGGLVARQPVAEMTDEHWHTVIDLNLSSCFYCSREALRHMPEGGRIVNVSSQASRDGGGAGATAYAASKAGMNGFTRGLAKEVADRGITVNAVAPGLILDTPFHPTFTPKEAQEATIARIPVGRPGLPADVAALVLYLASPEAGFVTGCVIDVNGGIVLT
ncbi:MAG TPA: SDR family oxidoreductase [Candidatus Dormibacteraeota bacterium]|jgi:3-oxoacyl-[acyl-carrier protein] reductase|nr:SDR family oxidoreductase [Candidatus Dormibacteraeota bacterium]